VQQIATLWRVYVGVVTLPYSQPTRSVKKDGVCVCFVEGTISMNCSAKYHHSKKKEFFFRPKERAMEISANSHPLAVSQSTHTHVTTPKHAQVSASRMRVCVQERRTGRET
jgi:hypothetical protein